MLTPTNHRTVSKQSPRTASLAQSLYQSPDPYSCATLKLHIFIPPPLETPSNITVPPNLNLQPRPTLFNLPSTPLLPSDHGTPTLCSVSQTHVQPGTRYQPKHLELRRHRSQRRPPYRSAASPGGLLLRHPVRQAAAQQAGRKEKSSGDVEPAPLAVWPVQRTGLLVLD